MNWQLPNKLTAGRVVLSLVFFVLLGLYRQGSASGPWLLNTAFVVYIIAGITDILDGYFARKWNMTSAFGRMVDPIVDKVMVVGAFMMLLGRNFMIPVDGGCAGQFERDLPEWFGGGMFSAVQAWMVVAILFRELMVSGVRGYSESRGRVFPATFTGKIKMFIQSVAVCVVIFQMANVQTAPWAVIVKISVVWLAVIVTLLSGVVYLRKAIDVLAHDSEMDAAPRPSAGPADKAG